MKTLKQGIALAQYNLGRMYANGEDVPQNYVLAYMWLSIASSNDLEDSIKGRDWIEKLMCINLSSSSLFEDAIKARDTIEDKMSSTQIKKAQEMARNRKPSSKWLILRWKF